MQKKYLIILLLIVSMVWLFFIRSKVNHADVSSDKAENNIEQKELNQNSVIQLGNDNKLPQIPLPKSENAGTADVTFEQAIEQCAPEFANEKTPSDLIARIYHEYENKNEIESQNVELENLHFTIDGEERRLQILRDVNPIRVEYHYFKLDAEGIPEYMPLPSENMSEWIKDQNSIYHEQRIAVTFKDQSYLQYEVINNQIKDWFWRGQKKSLFCQNNSCVCK